MAWTSFKKPIQAIDMGKNKTPVKKINVLIV